MSGVADDEVADGALADASCCPRQSEATHKKRGLKISPMPSIAGNSCSPGQMEIPRKEHSRNKITQRVASEFVLSADAPEFIPAVRLGKPANEISGKVDVPPGFEHYAMSRASTMATHPASAMEYPDRGCHEAAETMEAKQGEALLGKIQAARIACMASSGDSDCGRTRAGKAQRFRARQIGGAHRPCRRIRDQIAGQVTELVMSGMTCEEVIDHCRANLTNRSLPFALAILHGCAKRWQADGTLRHLSRMRDESESGSQQTRVQGQGSSARRSQAPA
eukprot:gb/GFBE01043120.1/.p1 GENE.gb/GFBE01043120.1/~~gb/GFBE01043120.1/.p1  ORF type:complete len:278 (+),score=20.06 gb/GFBE01043120.1/:1-834(+)